MTLKYRGYVLSGCHSSAALRRSGLEHNRARCKVQDARRKVHVHHQEREDKRKERKGKGEVGGYLKLHTTYGRTPRRSVQAMDPQASEQALRHTYIPDGHRRLIGLEGGQDTHTHPTHSHSNTETHRHRHRHRYREDRDTLHTPPGGRQGRAKYIY